MEMEPELSALIPESKHDTEKARLLVRRGYPAVAPVIAQILVWLQDLNWPVASVLSPFLASIGRPLAPHVRGVLDGDDDVWKYNLLVAVVAASTELAGELRIELEHIASAPGDGEVAEEVNVLAEEILAAMPRIRS